MLDSMWQQWCCELFFNISEPQAKAERQEEVMAIIQFEGRLLPDNFTFEIIRSVLNRLQTIGGISLKIENILHSKRECDFAFSFAWEGTSFMMVVHEHGTPLSRFEVITYGDSLPKFTENADDLFKKVAFPLLIQYMNDKIKRIMGKQEELTRLMT